MTTSNQRQSKVGTGKAMANQKKVPFFIMFGFIKMACECIRNVLWYNTILLVVQWLRECLSEEKDADQLSMALWTNYTKYAKSYHC